MIKKKHCSWIRWAAGLMACLMILINTGFAGAETQKSTVLKVAFPELAGISEIDQYGNHKGLLVDYLNEIAKYTGWEYEYIEVSNEDLIPNFLDGQYDLMGGTFYSPDFEKYFAYPDYNTSRSRAVLLCRKDDDSLRGYDLTSLNGKTIGVYEKAVDKIKHLKEFLSRNDLNCKLHYYTNEDMGDTANLYRQLRDGEVDMLLGNDLEVGGEFRMVTSFQAQPYYIVTTVGNNEVLNGLNTALQHILESTPNFAEETFNANFPDIKLADLQFTDKELSYIEKKKTVTVAIPENWHPLFCKDAPVAHHHEGMVVDLLGKISKDTGLQFTFQYADTYKQSIEMVREGKADISGAYLDGDEQAFSNGLALSQSYIGLNNIVVRHKSVSYPGDKLTCGILSGRALPSSMNASKIREYDTAADLMEAVNDGKVDYIYGVSAMLEQEMQRNHNYLNVVPVTQVSDKTDVAFAIARPIEPELLTILNKAVGNISTEEKTAMLDRNLVSIGYTGLSFKELIYANPLAFILILGGVLLLITVGVLFVIKSRMKNSLMQSRLEAAEAKSQAKSEFLSQMSHEIRTPMNAIVGLTDLACKSQGMPLEVGTKLKKIRSSSQYLLSLINDILDMSQIENEKMEVEQKYFSMKNVLEELQGMMRNQAEQEELQFDVSCQIHHDGLVGDPLRLRQILTNLLSNAIKFTPAGGKVELQVKEIACEDQVVKYHFSVQDTGVGIIKEDQERIFAPFEQLRPSVSQSMGTGLGLPISRNLARMMGGNLQVKSEPGKGTEFFMDLAFPMGTEDDVQAAKDSKDAAKSLEGMRVLVVEDNELNAEIARELLEMQGAQVERAADGQEAVDRFSASAPGEFQAILMDIRMPIKNGHQATREIRASGHPNADIPIIAMTANSFKEDEEAARATGMSAFVSKPVDVNHLIDVLKRYL